MNSKHKCLFIFIVLITIFFGIAIFNRYLDPYGLFNNDSFISNIYDLYLKSQQREIFTIKMKLNNSKKYEYAIIGGSGTNEMLKLVNCNSVFNINDDRITKLTLYLINLKEAISIIYGYLQIHPEVKKIYFCIEPFMLFNSQYQIEESYNYDFKGNLTLNEFVRIYYSPYTIKDSFYKIKHLIKYSRYAKYRYFYYPVYPRRQYVSFINIDISYAINIIKEMKQLKDFCDLHDIDITFLVIPVNSAFLATISQEKYNEIYKFKKYLAQVVDYYDFMYPNEYNNVKMDSSKFFYDMCHPTRKIGYKVFDVINNKNSNSNYGKYITKENYKEILKDEEKAFIKYKEENKDYIEKFKTYNTDEKSADFNYLLEL